MAGKPKSAAVRENIVVALESDPEPDSPSTQVRDHPQKRLRQDSISSSLPSKALKTTIGGARGRGGPKSKRSSRNARPAKGDGRPSDVEAHQDLWTESTAAAATGSVAEDVTMADDAEGTQTSPIRLDLSPTRKLPKSPPSAGTTAKVTATPDTASEKKSQGAEKRRRIDFVSDNAAEHPARFPATWTREDVEKELANTCNSLDRDTQVVDLGETEYEQLCAAYGDVIEEQMTVQAALRDLEAQKQRLAAEAVELKNRALLARDTRDEHGKRLAVCKYQVSAQTMYKEDLEHVLRIHARLEDRSIPRAIPTSTPAPGHSTTSSAWHSAPPLDRMSHTLPPNTPAPGHSTTSSAWHSAPPLDSTPLAALPGFGVNGSAPRLCASAPAGAGAEPRVVDVSHEADTSDAEG